MDYGIGVRKHEYIKGVKALRLYQYGDSLHSAILDIRVVMAIAIHVGVGIFPALFSFAT